jgi:FkbM family methyltransferase
MLSINRQRVPIRSLREVVVSCYARVPEHPCKLRLFRWMRKLLRIREVTAMTDAGIMSLDIDDFVQHQIFYHGTYEPQTLALVRSLLPVGGVFLDVGANVGHYSLAAAKIVGTKGTVVAIEPNPETCARLIVNRRLNPHASNMTICNLAVSEHSHTARFQVSSLTNQGTTKMLEHDEVASNAFYSACVNSSALLESMGIRAINVAKIDVEGAELSVLRGLLTSGRVCVDHFVCEFLPEHFSYGQRPQDLLSDLDSFGYNVSDVHGLPYEFGNFLPEGNLWAMRRK